MSKKIISKISSFLLYSILMGCVVYVCEGMVSSVKAEEIEPIVSQIIIEGNQRIETSTILSYLKIKKGDVLSQSALNDSLKALYKTNFFVDVHLEPKGNILVVTVVENPIINRVAFEGNQRVTSETLDKEVGITPRTVYTRNKVQEAQQKLMQIYRLSGRFAAKVEPKIIKLPENRVDLVFEIEEGPLTQVQKINFIGNKRFSESTLESVIQTKEARWYRFFTSDDTYDPDRMSYDQEKLRQFYLNHGYADFRVLSAIAELSPDQKDFFVTYTIEEGEKYKFGKVEIENNIPAISEEKLRQVIPIEEGDWYSAKLVEQTIEKLMEAAGEEGYAFVEPKPRLKKNAQEQTVDIVFVIEEGPKIYIQRIDIVGNTRTLDSVIRREFLVSEGDAFNAVKIRKSIQNIKDLNFFKKVDLAKEPGESSDKIILKVEVEEQSTGELNFAGGYGQNVGILGEVSVRERNLLGHGQEVGVKTRFAKRQKLIDVEFIEPFFLNRPLTFGVNGYMRKDNFQSQSSFDERSNGAGVWIGYNLAEYWGQTLGYNVSYDKIGNLPSKASQFIREQQGSQLTSEVYQILTYDRRDSKLDPTSGYMVTLRNDFAGVGGNARYLRNVLSGTYYYPVDEEIILSAKGKIGYIMSMGKTVRSTDRFMIGGDSLRGFDYAGIGPRDRTGGHDALGGMRFYTASLEALFPIGLPNEFGVKGSVFMDAGSLWDAQKRNRNIFDDSAIRASYGFGVAWKSPMGPLRVNVGWPLIKKSLDKTRVFLFGFTTRF